MLVEELLLSIKEDALPSSCSPEEVTNRILRLLAHIEKRPMKSKEAVLFKEACAETMKRFQLESDDNLISLIDTRFAVEFIPSISSLGLQPSPEKVSLNPNDVDITNKMRIDTDHAVEESQHVNVDSKRYYYLCSIRRQQTALYTSYRMYIDGTREIYDKGDLGNPIMNSTPIMILGAKKFKSGSLPVVSLIWDTQDIKQWKDKTAIGKCTKLPNNIYYGVSFLPVNENISSNLIRSSSLASVESESSNIPTAAAAVSVPDSPGSPSSRRVQAGIADENTTTTVVSKPSASNRPISSRWSLRSANSMANTSTAGTDQECLSTMKDAIAVSVCCKGMEKLIHVTGLVALPTPAAGGIGGGAEVDIDVTTTTNQHNNSSSDNSTGTAAAISTGTTDTMPADTTKAPTSVHPITAEKNLLDILHTFTTTTTTNTNTTTVPAPATIPTENLLYFRNRLPKKITLLNNNNKTMHSVEFSKISRVQTPSRKNIVIEEVPYSTITTSSGTGSGSSDHMMSTEWTVDNEKPSLLQVNKLGFYAYIITSTIFQYYFLPTYVCMYALLLLSI